MTRHEFSYWLEAVQKRGAGKGRLEAFREALRGAGLCIPLGPLVLEIDLAAKMVRGEVSPAQGTTEEDDDIASKVGRVACAFPDFDVELRECDEEDHAVELLTRWSGGMQVHRGRARTMPADRKYDDETVVAVAEWLRANGDAPLAGMVRTRFLGK